jgi:hypothetical protein
MLATNIRLCASTILTEYIEIKMFAELILSIVMELSMPMRMDKLI